MKQLHPDTVESIMVSAARYDIKLGVDRMRLLKSLSLVLDKELFDKVKNKI